MEYVRERGRITIGEATRIIEGVSHSTIKKRLADLVQNGFLSQQGKGRGTWYQF